MRQVTSAGILHTYMHCAVQYSNMAKAEFGFSLAATAVLSCVFLIIAIWLSTILRPPSTVRPGSAHAVTLNPPVPLSPPKTQSSQKAVAQVSPTLTAEQRHQCYRTCRLDLVESLPENLTFVDDVTPPVGSTHESWNRLTRLAEKRVIMAAYKSSFRGKHVLEQQYWPSARLGDDVFDTLRSAAVERGVRLEAVENYPPKDRGDNEDVAALTELGLMERRRLNMAGIFNTGVMHSKFLLVDDDHFYLGSANFDWRSLNQKMELGVHVENCPCLSRDLKSIYDAYWTIAGDGNEHNASPALTSRSKPLTIRVAGVDTEVYLAGSPRQLNGARRDWDLDAILSAIDETKYELDIHVMDYVPMFVYRKPCTFWPAIDDAIRRAVVERGVKVRFLTAALHFVSESLHALRSLQVLGNTMQNGGGVDVKILNIPAITEAQRAFARERRTHRKFMITDDTLLIGTSNWSGDYFSNTTGVAIVMKQRASKTHAGIDSREQPLLNQARQLFERDWKSKYATDLNEYFAKCYDQMTRRDLCKADRMAYQLGDSEKLGKAEVLHDQQVVRVPLSMSVISYTRPVCLRRGDGGYSRVGTADLDNKYKNEEISWAMVLT